MNVYDYHDEPPHDDPTPIWWLLTLFILACVAGYQFAAWLA